MGIIGSNGHMCGGDGRPSPIETESSEEDMSVEVLSPLHRPMTRSVSAKCIADEMELEDVDAPLASSPPRPRKVAGTPGMFTNYFQQRC